MTHSDEIADVRRIGGRLGAEVVGVDLASDLGDGLVADLNALLLEHKLLVFRDQDLDDAAQAAFTARFGPLTKAHPTLLAAEDDARILPVNRNSGNNHWHTDVTFVRNPPKITVLRAVVVPPYGGDTLIADSASAYADLPEPLRLLADQTRAVHTNDYDYVQPQFLSDELRKLNEQFISRKWKIEHPVVRVHPETGNRNLFIGGFARRIVGLSGPESRTILDLWQSYVTRPENVVRWRWRPGDVLVWDNRTTQHYAPNDYGDLPREARRTTAAGDVPVGIDGTPSRVLEGDLAEHYTPVTV